MMKKSSFILYTILYISLFSLCLFSVAVPAFAQFNTPLETSINMDMTPENPGPNQTVQVVISSFSTDLNNATITWTVNGKTIKTSKGDKTFQFTTGNINSSTKVGLTVKTFEGDIVHKTYIIQPTTVDLIWQTDGYVPPFYKGKTLFSYQNRIQFVAIPHIIGSNGQEIPAQNLSYKWTRNGTVVGDYSGEGKNTYTLISSIIARPLDIQVEVTSPTATGVGYAEVVVNPTDPQIMFYSKDPLYGIQFQKALVGTVLLDTSKEFTVIAEPYFFGVLNQNDPSLSYTWNINGNQIDSDTTQAVRVFRQKEGTSGVSGISLSMESTDKVLQAGSKSFNLSFSSQ